MLHTYCFSCFSLCKYSCLQNVNSSPLSQELLGLCLHLLDPRQLLYKIAKCNASNPSCTSSFYNFSVCLKILIARTFPSLFPTVKMSCLRLCMIKGGGVKINECLVRDVTKLTLSMVSMTGDA